MTELLFHNSYLDERDVILNTCFHLCQGIISLRENQNENPLVRQKYSIVHEIPIKRFLSFRKIVAATTQVSRTISNHVPFRPLFLAQHLQVTRRIRIPCNAQHLYLEHQSTSLHYILWCNWLKKSGSAVNGLSSIKFLVRPLVRIHFNPTNRRFIELITFR